MKLTNQAGLHPLVYRAILAQAKGHPSMSQEPRFASVTELLSPPCQVALKRRHWPELKEEAEDRIWALFGSAMHHVVEMGSQDENTLTEKRLGLNVGGKLVTGGLDSYVMGAGWLADYKLTSVWSIVYKDRAREWTAQENLYAEMLRRAGFEVKRITIEAFLRDWSRRDASRDSDYPQKNWIRIPIDIWTPEKVMAYALDRVLKLQAALDADVPEECSREDRWEKETTWAVFKGKNKRATKVFKEESKKETRANAEAYIVKQKKPDEFHIEDRPGIRTRCKDYCIVAQACPHYRKHLESLYGRSFGPDKDEETRPPEMSQEEAAVDLWGCTPKPRKTGKPPVSIGGEKT